MHADIKLVQQKDDKASNGESPLELSIRPDPNLDAAGWVRRHMVDPARAKETTELYESLGFEVMRRNLTPDDFGPNCSECAADACQSYVLIYTRRTTENEQSNNQSKG